MSICDNCANNLICHGADWGKDKYKMECKHFVSKACANCFYRDRTINDFPCDGCRKHNKWRDLTNG